MKSEVVIPLLVVGAIAGGFAVFMIMRNRQQQSNPVALPAGQYKNAETWNIAWNQDGLPEQVTIHRDATRV